MECHSFSYFGNSSLVNMKHKLSACTFKDNIIDWNGRWCGHGCRDGSWGHHGRGAPPSWQAPWSSWGKTSWTSPWAPSLGRTTHITIRVDQMNTNNKLCLTIVTTISIAVMDNGCPAQCKPFFLQHALKFIPLYNYACNSIVIRLGIP